MMNISRSLIILGITVFLIFSCSSENYMVEVEPSGTRIVKGVFDRSLLEHDSTFTWYKSNYGSYSADSNVVHEIIPLSHDIHFVMILGTWCGDSKREVPELFKIFDAVNIPNNKIIMFGVDRSKKSQDGFTDKYNVQRVPTLIVFKGDQELGRIVENPRETLERDLLRILNKQ